MKLFLSSLLITTAVSFPMLSAPIDSLQIGCKMRLPDNINAFGTVIMPLLSPDGSRLYFDRKSYVDNTGGLSDPDDIWVSQRLPNGNWGEPTNVKSLNTSGSDVLLSIAQDGESALVYNGSLARSGGGFGMSQFVNGTWQPPVPLKIKDYYNYSGYYFGNLSADGRVLLLSLDRRDTRGSLDLYVSFLEESDNTWSAPINLGSVVNTSKDEYSPFLANDGKSLYFASMGHTGFGGFDLFVTRRLDDTWTSWSKPVNMGRAINTAGGERSITLNAAGDTLALISTDPDHFREGIYFICLPKSLRPGKAEKIAAPAPKSDSYYLYTIYFERGKSNVSASDAEAVLKFLHERDTSSSYTLSLQGFTCDLGEPASNKRLAAQRIAAVEQIIRKDGMKFRSTSRESIGESSLGDKILTDPERAQARRVEIRVQYPKK